MNVFNRIHKLRNEIQILDSDTQKEDFHEYSLIRQDSIYGVGGVFWAVTGEVIAESLY